MKSPVPVLASVVAGSILFIRERRARQAVERFAAAGLETLLNAIEANDAETGQHVRRVATYALIIAESAGLAAAAPSSVSRSFTTSARSTKRCSISSMTTTR